MFNVTLFMYEAFGSMFALIIPLILLMFLVWLVLKIGKGFWKSILK